MNTSWLDTTEYPFQNNYFDTSAGKMHYVDEGQGAPLVMVHGNGMWSYLFRDWIKGLSDSYRCIAPDLLGFGLSDKPANWTYTPQDQAAIFAAFMDHLDLHKTTLAVHDWGAPIALNWAIQHPDRIEKLIVLNSWMWPLDDDKKLSKLSKSMHSAWGRFSALKTNRIFNKEVRRGMYYKSLFTPQKHAPYMHPYPKSTDRIGAWTLYKSMLDSSEWLQTLFDQRQSITNKRTLLCWGLKDADYELQMDKWLEILENHEVALFDVSKHYVPDEMGVDMVPRIRKFLDEA